MKRYLGIILLLVANISFCQSIEKKYPALAKKIYDMSRNEEFEPVVMEKEELKEISKDSRLLGYFSSGTIVWIKLTNKTSLGVEIFDFYFENNELYYVHNTFDQIIEKTQAKMNRTFWGKYVFKKGKIIDQEVIGHNRFENDELDPEKILVRESKRYSQLLLKRSKQGE